MFTALDIERFPARTLPALLLNTASRVPNRCFVREIPTDAAKVDASSYSFSEFEHAVAATAEALAELGIGAGDRILFTAENSLAWQVVAWAAQALRAVTCAAYSNLSPQALADIATRVKPCCLFVSNEAQLKQLEPVLPMLISSGLRLTVSPQSMPPLHPALRHRVTSELATTRFERATWERRVGAVSPDDVFLLLFTSGTGGKQKGVQLTQDAFVHALEGGRACTGMTEQDNGLMFLPFAHVAGECQFSLAVAMGHGLILATRREDLQRAFEYGPTYVFAVPMVYEKLMARVLAGIEAMPSPLRGLLREAVAALSRCGEAGAGSLRDRWLCTLGRLTVGKRLRSQLGGRIRMLASGGALAPVELVRFFEAIGIPYLSLYGMTETCGLISSSLFGGSRRSDTVGRKSPDLSLRLASDGELCVKGALLMRGYLEPEDNEAAFDADGFFHTGDLVERDASSGEVRIIGRSKDLIVLSTGKKLSPEPLESRLGALPEVLAAVILGEGRPCVCAMLFVAGQVASSPEQTQEKLFSKVQRQLASCSAFERPKRLLLIPRAPTDFPELMTPTFKLKRAAVFAHFAQAIEQLYDTDGGSVMVVRQPG